MDERAPRGLIIAALGAVVLAISVFQPWYGVNLTRSGAAYAQGQLTAVAHRFGNTTLQTEAASLSPKLSSLAGHQLFTVSARRSMRNVTLILLGLAGIALLASLLLLAETRGLLAARASQIALAGGLASVIVLFRLVVKPHPGSDVVSLTPSWGIWLALLGAGAILTGGLLAHSAELRKPARPKYGPGPPLARLPS